VACATLL
jgi:hypothetical protein